jgi:predicted metal-dependent peptidase|nr:MAG TPA: Putative metallopeptidase domain protein [Caudoviricetes sp.]
MAKRLEDYDVVVGPSGKKIDMAKLLDDQHRAMASLRHIAPHFGGLITSLQFVYTYKVDTQATDGFRVFVNPEFTDSLDHTGKVFVMAHELMHCLLNHLRRGKKIDAMNQKGNIAADYEVNQTLVDMGLFKTSTIEKLQGFIDAKWSKVSFETIYSKMPNPPSMPSQGGGGDKNQQGQQNQEGQGSSGTDANLQGTIDTAGSMLDAKEGQKIAKEEGYDDVGANESALEKEWENKAREVAKKLKGTGAGNDILADKLLATSVKGTNEWKKILKDIVGRSVSPEDKRRGYAHNNILVSQDRVALSDKEKYDNVDYIMAWVDTSGSMSQEDLNKALSMMLMVAQAKKPTKLVVCQFDTRVADIKEFDKVDRIEKDMRKMKIKGGGGTDVKCCFDLLADKKSKYARQVPELVVIFTDGYLDQYRRDKRRMQNLVWVVQDHPSFELEYPDSHTKLIRK